MICRRLKRDGVIKVRPTQRFYVHRALPVLKFSFNTLFLEGEHFYFELYKQLLHGFE